MAAAKKAASRRPPQRRRPPNDETPEDRRLRMAETARRKAEADAHLARIRESRLLVRIGVSGAEVFEDPETILEWDDEELRRGYRRDPKTGKFNEKDAPNVVPRQVYNELWRRTVATANEKMRESLPEAVDILMGLARSTNVKDADRIKAIGMIMDRVLGKVPDKVLFAETDTGTKPKWADALDVSIVSGDED